MVVALTEMASNICPAAGRVESRSIASKLAEICARACNLGYFNFDVSHRDSLLRQSDARLLRVASFYRADQDAGVG